MSAAGEIYRMQPVGLIHSCFKEKFGVPRQSGLVTEARARLELLPPYNQADAVRALDGFSHLWLQFVFHQSPSGWTPLVRPPRLGGNRKVGVFASRSPFRPNRLGLSLVRLEGIETDDGVSLLIAGIDLVEGTPVLDIKPYLPYAEAIPEARAGFAGQAPAQRLGIGYSAQAQAELERRMSAGDSDLQALIEGVLGQDPRPAYRQGEEARVYGMLLKDFNLKWCYREDRIEVLDLEPVQSDNQG